MLQLLLEVEGKVEFALDDIDDEEFARILTKTLPRLQKR